ncbi:carbohydrate kinase family protein [Halorubraceae archaeon YAN]|nr:carbohydrate kinase family protein [Halorubraceae archaeon YAN]
MKSGLADPTVVVIGAAAIDRHYRLSNMPTRDGGAYAHAVTDAHGGVGANVSIALEKLGVSTGLIAQIGDDDIGAQVSEHLEKAPIDNRRVRQTQATSTHCLVLGDEQGDRMIVAAGDSAKQLALTEADLAYIKSADILFFTAYVPDRVTQTIISEFGGKDGPALAFDLSGPLEELEGRGTEPETIDRLLEHLTLFVGNEVAVSSYFDEPTTDPITALSAAGVDRGAITAGSSGATVFCDDTKHHVPAFSIDPVDTTGAGDTFVAGLLTVWVIEGKQMAVAGEFAAAAAALNCVEPYAQSGLPTRRDVALFLDERRT